MLNVVLITPDYVEANTPTGVYTASLARSLSRRGHRVRVICKENIHYDPHFETRESATIHRISLRKDATQGSFALQASRCVLDLSRAGMCDVIECIDAPSCVLAIAAMRRVGAMDASLHSICIDPVSKHTDLVHAAHDAVDSGVWVGGEDPDQISFSIESGVWRAPTSDAPLFVACDARDEASREFVIDGFKASDAPELGWSLALLDESGRWSILEDQSKENCGTPARSVLVTTTRSAPILPTATWTQGDLCLYSMRSSAASIDGKSSVCCFDDSDPDSLADVMRSVMGMSDEAYEQEVRAMTDSILDKDNPLSVAAEHERLWASRRQQLDTDNCVGMWKQLETYASVCASGGSPCLIG